MSSIISSLNKSRTLASFIVLCRLACSSSFNSLASFLAFCLAKRTSSGLSYLENSFIGASFGDSEIRIEAGLISSINSGLGSGMDSGS
jgi:hypothetical protein